MGFRKHAKDGLYGKIPLKWMMTGGTPLESVVINDNTDNSNINNYFYDVFNDYCSIVNDLTYDGIIFISKKETPKMFLQIPSDPPSSPGTSAVDRLWKGAGSEPSGTCRARSQPMSAWLRTIPKFTINGWCKPTKYG